MKIVVVGGVIEFYLEYVTHLQIGRRKADWVALYGDLEYSDYTTFSYPYPADRKLDLR